MPKGIRNIYTQEIQDYIRANIKGVKYKDMSFMLKKEFGVDFSEDSISGWCLKNGCPNGRPRYFEKGNIPANKGKTWDEYLTKEQQEKARKTCFSSERIVNNQDHLWFHKVGDEIEDKDGYVKVKVYEHAKDNGGVGKYSTRMWQFKQRYIWEQHYGKIPDGYMVIFLDGNKRNFDIENLALVSQRENAILNMQDLRCEDPDITRIGIDVAKLKIAIADKKEGNKNGKK